MKHANLLITGEPAVAYKCNDIIDGWIWWSYVGRAILEEIFEARQDRNIAINVLPKDVPLARGVEASPVDLEDAYAKGFRIEGAFAGTGLGSSAIIEIPETLDVADSVCNSIMKVPCRSVAAFKTRFVLMHELVHANRILRGVMRKYAMGQRLGDSEEAIAIIITNMLMSEKGETQLRKYYDGPEALDVSTKDFLLQPGIDSVVQAIGNDHPKLKAALNVADVPVSFNPIYEKFKGS